MHQKRPKQKIYYLTFKIMGGEQSEFHQRMYGSPEKKEVARIGADPEDLADAPHEDGLAALEEFNDTDTGLTKRGDALAGQTDLAEKETWYDSVVGGAGEAIQGYQKLWAYLTSGSDEEKAAGDTAGGDVERAKELVDTDEEFLTPWKIAEGLEATEPGRAGFR